MKRAPHSGDLQRRRLLLAAAAALMPWRAAAGGQVKSSDTVSILDFGAQPGTDCTGAFNQACSVARRVHVPAGEYLLREAGWPSDTEIFGDGDRSILRMPADAAYLITNDSGSASPRQNIAGLLMRDLQLRGSCDADGMSEFRHLVSLNGVSGVRFERVLFRGFRGDAVYLGSGNRGASERHNTDVVIADCRFDGINRENRNGISVIDCDGLLVDGCRFENLTRHNMPGAIDIEPNRHPYHVVRHIHLRGNRFRRIGGSVGVISVYVLAGTPAPRDILVEHNLSEDYLGTGGFFHYNDNRAPAPESAHANVVVRDNDARRGATSFLLLSGKGIVLARNRFRDFAHSARIGSPVPAMASRDIALEGNLLQRCGTAGQSAVTVHSVDGLRFASNRFVDAGSAAAATSAAVLFGRGQSSGVSFENNCFETASPRRLIAIRKDPAHVLDPASNRFDANSLNGLANFFQAAR